MTEPAEPAIVRFCRHRRGGHRCTRPLDHPGLHRHRTLMWQDADSDPARCEGSGAPAQPMSSLPDEEAGARSPHGRALCPRCLRFVDLDEGRRLAEHDASDETETAEQIARRRDWLNRHGW